MKRVGRSLLILVVAVAILGITLASCSDQGSGTEERAIAHCQVAIEAIKQGQYEIAVKQLSQAVDADPTMALAYSWRAVAYASMGDCEAALEDSNRAVQMAPTSAQVYANRGYTYFVCGDCTKAVADCTLSLIHI